MIDCVGGPLGADLFRALALGGKAIVYVAYSPEPMPIHALDVLMKVASLESYAYRYFFDPPPPEDAPFIAKVIADSSTPPLQTRIAGRNPLDDWRSAVEATLRHPERGKRLLWMNE